MGSAICAMMQFRGPLPSQVGDPATIASLLERGLAADPRNPALLAKRGFLALDRKDYDAAGADFAAALALDPAAAALRQPLARCLIYLGQVEAALTVLEPVERPTLERGRALLELGRNEAAEHELRAVLTAHPDDAGAVRLLARLLRRAGRLGAELELYPQLHAQGADNAQLLYNWGWALALAGERERALRLMFDPGRVAAAQLPPPGGFTDIAEFAAQLAAEVLTNPNRVTNFPTEDEANRGSERIDNLFTGSDPALIAALIDALQAAVAAMPVSHLGEFDPWPRARPQIARLRPWGLIQRGVAYEEAHIHPTGWVSGVCYVQVPAAITDAGAAGGCIEYGPPPAVAKALPGFAPVRRYLPSVGLLLLAPSHYLHRTIPSGLDHDRISIAFDVVPERSDDGSPA